MCWVPHGWKAIGHLAWIHFRAFLLFFFVWTSPDSQWASQKCEHCTGEIVLLKKGNSLICVHTIDRLLFLKHLSSGFVGCPMGGRLLGSWREFGFVNSFLFLCVEVSDTQWDVHIHRYRWRRWNAFCVEHLSLWFQLPQRVQCQLDSPWKASALQVVGLQLPYIRHQADRRNQSPMD